MAATLRLFGIVLIFFIATGLTGCSSSSDSDSSGGSGVLNGRVFNTKINGTISSATVSIVGTNNSVQTDSQGEFKFKGVALGTFFLQVWKNDIGFINLGPVEIKEGEASYLPLGLIPFDGSWDVTLVWNGETDSYWRRVSVRSDGTCSNSAFGSGTWTLKGDEITMKFTEALSHYTFTGTMASATSMAGTLSHTTFGSGTWTAVKQ